MLRVVSSHERTKILAGAGFSIHGGWTAKDRASLLPVTGKPDWCNQPRKGGMSTFFPDPITAELTICDQHTVVHDTVLIDDGQCCIARRLGRRRHRIIRSGQASRKGFAAPLQAAEDCGRLATVAWSDATRAYRQAAIHARDRMCIDRKG